MRTGRNVAAFEFECPRIGQITWLVCSCRCGGGLSIEVEPRFKRLFLYHITITINHTVEECSLSLSWTSRDRLPRAGTFN